MKDIKNKEENKDSNVNITVNLQGVSTVSQESNQLKEISREEAIKVLDQGLIFPDAIEDRIKERVSEAVRQRKTSSEVAEKAFENFDPSRYSKARREEDPTFVAPGADVKEAMEVVFANDINKMQDQSRKKGFSIDLTTLSPEELEELRIANLQALPQGVNLVSVMKLLQDRMPEGDLTPDNWLKICEAKVIAERMMEEVTGQMGLNGVGQADLLPNEENGVAKAKTMAQQEVKKQFQFISSPEEEVIFGIEKGKPKDLRATEESLKQSVKAFTLHSGPADVTAFHDFYDLQIAFRHVWTELTDPDLREMGVGLFEEMVKLKKLGGDNTPLNLVTTATDLKKLMKELNDLRATIAENDPRLQLVQKWLSCSAKIWIKLDEPSKKTLYSYAVEMEKPINQWLWSIGKRPLLFNQCIEIIAKAQNSKNQSEELSRAEKMLSDLEERLSNNKSGYAFDIFAPDSCNYGILVNYRQQWEPKNYQVGELVSTIPLAPKEVRRFSKKRVVRKSRSEKETESSLAIKKTDISDTSRTHAEIVRNATNKTSFQHTAEGGVNFAIGEVKGRQSLTIDSSKHSQQTKKEFRESVLKASEEYKQDHRLEIITKTSEDYEESTSGEISNPNDEISVTYLFYELQRRYEISEQIHKITPVILVANDVPNPSEIDEEWLTAHDWILRKAILDDSYLPALNYLSQKFIGDEVSVDILRNNWLTQLDVVKNISQQVSQGKFVLETARDEVGKAVEAYANQIGGGDGGSSTGGRVFAGILTGGLSELFGGGGSSGDPEEMLRILTDEAKENLQRTEREQEVLRSQLSAEITALNRATNEYARVIENQFNRRAEILRLRAHIKDNILYYMQAIWDHEPPDQRFFRLYNKKVLHFTFPFDYQAQAPVQPNVSKPTIPNQGQNNVMVTAFFPPWAILIKDYKDLVEIANLDNLLGYKGNYMIFPLKKSNDLTTYMMQDYIDLQEVAYLWDPDELGNYSPEELKKLVRCLSDAGELNDENKEKFRDLLVKMYSNAYRPTEEVIVPTESLYIEALPGTHPILENFKLAHRAIDVKKVQAEVRHDELENIRLAARVLKGDYEDPDVEKKIIVDKGIQDVIVNP